MPGGAGLLSSRFPSAHDHNQLVLWQPALAGDVAAAADALLGGAGLAHRRVWVLDGALADALGPGLREAAYRREDELLLWHPPGEGLPVPGVVELDADERVAASVEGWAQDQPDWPREVVQQLGERVLTLLGVVDATFLGVRESGRVVARTDLFVRDGLAQVEEVVTEAASRNRGLASALVREAVRRAGEAGVDAVFLVADADDWPAGLYRRLGFADLGRTTSFIR